jgi:hypothetical protein
MFLLGASVMAAQVSKSTFAQKMGNRLDAAIKAHAKDDTNFGFTRLPAGIKNGVARLTKAYFAEHPTGHKHAGKFYFRMEATVVAPETLLVDGREMKIANLTTSQIFPCYETVSGEGQTRKVVTQEEAMAKVMNEMRKLGATTASLSSASHLEATAAALQKQGPYFRLSTSVREARIDPKTGQKGEEGVWENWNGIQGVEDFAAHAEVKQVSAVTGAATSAPSKNGTASPSKPTPPKQKEEVKVEITDTDVQEVTEEVTEETTEEGDTEHVNDMEIDELIAKANAKDKEAQKKLMSLALAMGVDKEEAESTATWEDLKTLMEQAQQGISQSEEAAATDEVTEEVVEETVEEEEEFVPKVTEVYGYFPIDKATKKKGTKKVEVEVVAVEEASKTVDLKAGKTLYKKVKFDDLVSAD